MNALVKSWTDAMQRAWAASAGSDLLDNRSMAWSQFALNPITHSESMAFALAGRVLKYGQSIAIALPMFSSESATKLVLYLHRLRFDALLGALRAPWLNPTNVATRTDFVLFSRPQSRFADLSRFASLHTKVIRTDLVPSTQTHHAQTLLIDANMPHADLLRITERSRPCAFVIDGTTCGTDHPGELDWALHEHFPTVPRIVLLALGDRDCLRSLNSSRANTHRFQVRLCDVARDTHPDVRARVGEVSDNTANDYLLQASSLYIDLRREQVSDPVFAQQLIILGKILRLLNELVVPLLVLEDVLAKCTRGGPYPIRSIARLFEILNSKHCRYGDIQNRVDLTTRHLRSCVDLLLQPTVLTGKAQAVLEIALDSRAKRLPTMILCGSSSEAQALETWLNDQLDVLWRDQLHVVSMDGVQSYRRAPRVVGRCVIVGTLWDSRLKWLAIDSQDILILSYPYQSAWSQRQAVGWWREFGVRSADDGDKLSLWSLRFPNSARLMDAQTTAASVDVPVHKLSAAGTYPRSAKVSLVPLRVDLDSALLDLIAEANYEPTDRSTEDPSALAFVTISTEELDHPLQWPRSKRILVLEKNEITEVLPTDLSAGAQLILLRHCEERVATQETLFDVLIDESQSLKAVLKVAEQWQSWCERVNAKFGSALTTQSQLRRKSIEVHETTVANWFRHGVIGPQDRKAVTAFAEFVGIPAASEAGRVVANAIEKIRGVRKAIGRDLRLALLERTKGADMVRIGSLMVDGPSFDAMIEVCHVVDVYDPQVSPAPVRAMRDLESIAGDVMAAYSGRLVFTTPGRKSMRDSPFRDIDKFRTCLELMCTTLHDHLQFKTRRFDEVLAEFTQAGLSYSGNMSDVTDGQFPDLRQYKGRKADMRRHFKIGTARDATRTLRIHFEWDDEISAIVIHHAGQHRTDSLT